MKKVIALVIVDGGVAYTYASDDVDIRVVDQDNIRAAAEQREEIPANIGFEELLEQAGFNKEDLKRYVKFVEKNDV